MNASAVAVMYHYVRPDDRQNWPGIFPLGPKEFEEQLDYLTELGAVVGPDVFGFERSERPQFLLTFDDGTRDHYTEVFPILRRRGMTGLFGVMSGPTVERHMPSVHLVHALLSKTSDDEIWARLEQSFCLSRLGTESQARTLYVYDEPLRARVKFALNFGLDADDAAHFLRRVLDEVQDLKQLLDDWYLTDDQIREMHAAGMHFAVHAHRHLAFQSPPLRFFESELNPCARWLSALTGQRPKDYIAAFGGSNATGARPIELEPILTGHGYRRAFLTEKGIESNPFDSLFCRRLDAVDLPPRQPAERIHEMLRQAVTRA